MQDAHERRFDVVVVWRFDRFARSVSHLLRALENFNALGIQFVSLSEQVDTGTPTGKMVFTVLGAVAELERNLIVERVRAGLRHARAKGKRLGRPRKSVDAARSGLYVLLGTRGERLHVRRVFQLAQSLPQLKSVRILLVPTWLQAIDFLAENRTCPAKSFRLRLFLGSQHLFSSADSLIECVIQPLSPKALSRQRPHPLQIKNLLH